MTNYSYVALDVSGARKSGQIEAKDRDTAIATIKTEGRFVVEISEEKSKAQTSTFGQSRKVSKAELALMSRRMSDLAAAGLPLDRVLQVIAEQSESPVLAEIALSALEDVRSGLPVSQALAKHPKLFPPLFTETLRAGEASGQFAEVCSRLAEFQQIEVTRRSQLSAAMVYPAVLGSVAIGVVIFLLTFVVPRLSLIFRDMKNELPLSTKILLGTTAVITQNYILILASMAGTYLLYRGWAMSESGAWMRDRMLLRLPVAGKVITKAVISRYARTLSTLVFGGVPILEALRLSGLAAGNRVFQRTSDQVADEVREGRSIHQAMQDTAVFPPVLTHMVAIGEETGDLPKMLNRVSDSLDFEVDNGMRKLMSMLEPIIVLVMGAFVAFVVISILLPIFMAQDAIK